MTASAVRAGRAQVWAGLGTAALLSLVTACASAPPPEASERPFIKLAARGLGLWVRGAGGEGARTLEELELQLGAELERLYHTRPARFSGDGQLAPLDARVLYGLAEARVDDLVIVEPVSGPAGLGARVSVLTVTDEARRLAFELEPRPGESAGAERLARRIADRLAAQFTDPAAGAPLDTLALAERLAARGACPEAVRIYERDLPAGGPSASVSRATRDYEHRRTLERCRSQLALEAKRAADRSARFSLGFQLDRVDSRFHATIREAARAARLEAELQKLTDKPAVLELGKDVLLLRLRYHAERYQRAAGKGRSVHREQPAIFFEAWQPALRATARLAEELGARIPGTQLETYLRLETLDGDWLEIGFGRVGAGDELRISDKLRVHQTDVAEDTLVESSSPRDLRALIFVLGPPRTLDGKPTVYGPAVDFLGL